MTQTHCAAGAYPMIPQVDYLAAARALGFKLYFEQTNLCVVACAVRRHPITKVVQELRQADISLNHMAQNALTYFYR